MKLKELDPERERTSKILLCRAATARRARPVFLNFMHFFPLEILAKIECWPKFSSISYIFLEILAKSYVCAPQMPPSTVGASSYGESWTPHPRESRPSHQIR